MAELVSGSADDSRDSSKIRVGDSSLTESGRWKLRTFDDRGEGVSVGDF